MARLSTRRRFRSSMMAESITCASCSATREACRRTTSDRGFQVVQNARGGPRRRAALGARGAGIPGESLLLWLQDQARPDATVSEPRAEDWGWYSYVEWKGCRYLLGSSASDEEGGEREWILQVEKQRSFGQKILGLAKMDEGDEC